MHLFAANFVIFRRKPSFHLKIAVILAISAGLGACTDPPPHENLPAVEQEPTACIPGGQLIVETFGAIQSPIEWRQPDVRCEGMKRPKGEGARLRFAGEYNAGDEVRPLAFILSIPDLQKGQTADELSTRVTLIEEENGRFFSTRDSEVCWSNITQHDPLLNSSGEEIPNHYIIGGLTYCVAPVAELNGSASVTLSDMKFTGQLSWAQE